MEKPKDLFSLEGISCLSFNKDYSMCVLSKKDSNLYIYEMTNQKDINTWKLIHKLSQHMLYICSVDWHPDTNRIISSSHDKNIFVWNYQQSLNTWKPEIVIFETKVSVLSVKWNIKGDKFVACTGNKIVGTGYYETTNKWWTCMKMKEHYSAVTCSKFDESGLFIISGSTDNRVYISSAYVKDNDTDIDVQNLPYEPVNHGELLMAVKADAWVNDVCWSKSGKYCFAATHDSIVYIIDNKEKNYSSIYLTHSPLSHIVALSDTSFIGVSFDRHIYIYEKGQEEWTMKRCITKDDGSNESVKKEEVAKSITDRLKMFQGNASKKTSLVFTSDSKPVNIHSGNINSINIANGSLYTSDYTGFIKIWPLS